MFSDWADLRSLKEMDFDNWDGISGWTVNWSG